MADLGDARTEIYEEFEQGAAVNDPTLVGLVLIARELSEQLEYIDKRLVRIMDSLEIIARGIQTIALKAELST